MSSSLMTRYPTRPRVCCIRTTFSLARFCTHSDLHSFPTRRSSDLTGAVNFQLWLRNTVPGPGRSIATRACSSPVAMDRSEEHTSELQSHSDLVCRLLLEKKKREGRDGRHECGRRRWRRRALWRCGW